MGVIPAARVLLARLDIFSRWIYDVLEARAQNVAAFQSAIGVPDPLPVAVPRKMNTRAAQLCCHPSPWAVANKLQRRLR